MQRSQGRKGNKMESRTTTEARGRSEERLEPPNATEVRGRG